MQVTCSCGKVLNVPEKLAGKSARCPACKKIFQMPGEAPAGPLPARIMLECSCGKKLAAPAIAAGKTVRCPKCSKELTVPAAAKKPSAPAIVPMPETTVHAPPARSRKLVPPPAPAPDLSFDVEAAPPEPPKPAVFPDDSPGGDAEKAVYGIGNPKCPNCKADLPYGAQFCVECGTSLATGAKVKTVAKPGTKKKRTLRDLDSEDWTKIIKIAVVAIVLALAIWYVHKPHGMTAEEMKNQAHNDREAPKRTFGPGAAE